jgi:hypothetical protein
LPLALSPPPTAAHSVCLSGGLCLPPHPPTHSLVCIGLRQHKCAGAHAQAHAHYHALLYDNTVLSWTRAVPMGPTRVAAGEPREDSAATAAITADCSAGRLCRRVCHLLHVPPGWRHSRHCL